MSTYAFSDLHGQYKLWEQIKNFITPEDTVYCLGDCGDRGPHGWQIIKEVLATPNIIYVRGNHDQFIIDEDYYLWEYNGGAPTIAAAEQDTDEEWLRVQKKLSETPLIQTYVNKSGEKITLCHAGFDPNLIQLWDDEEILWNRFHMHCAWPEAWKDSNIIIVHGHTPVQYMNEYIPSDEDPRVIEPGAYWYCGGHKCCIDQGCILDGYALLLDLDTFEEHIFSAEIEKGKLFI